MTQRLSHRISFFALTMFVIQAFFSTHIQAQISIDIPEDLTWECIDEIPQFIYQNTDGVIISEDSDPTIVYELTLPIDVEIEELGCLSVGDPGVLRRITRTFVYETGDPLDVSCPLYGDGFICATQVIEVRDETPPTFLEVPDNVEIECNEWVLKDYLLENDFDLVFDDNCETPTLQTSYAIDEGTECSAEKSYIFTFTLTDVCGLSANATHVVNVVDNTPPEIIFDPEIPEVFSCEGEVEWPSLEDSFDNCSGTIVGWDGPPTPVPQDCPNNLLLQRYATATDGCGNPDTKMYSIAVIDDQPPQFIELLTDLTIQCDNTAAIELALSAVPTFDDGCNDGAFLIPPSSQTLPGVCDQNYTVEKTFIAEDACGNLSESLEITITIQDTEAPIITPPTIWLEIECGQSEALEEPEVNDLCDENPTWSNTPPVQTGDLSDGDLISTTTYTATDACGNISHSSVVVSIVDTQPPYFTSFPSDTLLSCEGTFVPQVLNFDDACSETSTAIPEIEIANFDSCRSNIVVTSTYTISDAAGNETTQTQYITYLDEDPPILLTPLDSMFYQCAYEVPECLEIFEGLEFDDCSSGKEVLTGCEEVVVEGNCEEQACIIERTYFFEDACGNQGSAKHYITVQESVLNPEMPTGITPNGDGLNDAFVIKGIGPSLNTEPGEVQCDWLEDTNMRVINRWGSLVFEEANYRNDWEGTNESGEDLPQGTYFVVFEALGESFSTYLDLRR